MPLPDNVRTRRLRLGLSLNQLASRTGVSRSMISAVERGAKSPTIHTLCRIAAGLACTVSELIDEVGSESVHVVRAAQRPTFRDEDSGVERQVLSTALVEHGLEAVWYSIPPHRDAGPFPAEALGSIEHITVIDGQLDLVFDDQSLRLEAGDSVTYRLNTVVTYRNAGDETCRLLLVIDKSYYRQSSGASGR